jgi:glycerol-3-phosphate acyltransferase PlsY
MGGYPETAMMELLAAAGWILLGYLCGSLPFALWVTRMVSGVDVRRAGSGHVTATNTIRQAGWRAGLVVAVLDIAKGFLPVRLAQLSGAQADWLLIAIAAAVLTGHCWSLLAGFSGGMGLSVSAGATLAVAPLAMLVGTGVLIALVLTIRHAARATVAAGLVIPWVFYTLGWRGLLFYMALAVGVIVAARFASNWRRQYRELWLDREKAAGPPD